MRETPVFDARPEPHTADGEVSLRRREIVIRLDELVDALTRHAEEFGDFRHADQVDRHVDRVKNLLSKCN
jgi:hypothetical protein